ERVLVQVPGVRDAAVVGASTGPGDTAERVQAVLVIESGANPEEIVRAANSQLEEHQKIRRALVWPDGELPRTEGTRKLKRAAIREWVTNGATRSAPVRTAGDPLADLVAKYAGRADLAASTTIDELGLSSIERVDLMVALEDKFQTRIDESAFAEARDIGQLRALVTRGATADWTPAEPVDF